MTPYVLLFALIVFLLILGISARANRHHGIGENNASGGAWIVAIWVVGLIVFAALQLGLFTF